MKAFGIPLLVVGGAFFAIEGCDVELVDHFLEVLHELVEELEVWASVRIEAGGCPAGMLCVA